MPKYIRNSHCDIDFLSNQGVTEYLEDELSELPPKLMELEVTKSLFHLMRDKSGLEQVKEKMQGINWPDQPFELQAIAVGLKLFNRN